jgi:DNA-binding MarR family transcriptional regulator
MHAMFFGLKRAFQSTLRLTRPYLARLGLTAARYDMMHALKGETYGKSQLTLRRTLGVTAPTVSRMLRSLEELGLVRRERNESDRRQRRVSLTELGRRALRRAERALMDSGLVPLAIDSALTDSWWDGDAAFLAMCDLDSRLALVCRGFRDHGHLVYPWHPDD